MTRYLIMTRYLMFTVILTLVAPRAPSSADTATATLFAEANARYRKGSYDEARERYLDAHAAGARDARLMYNLGNACFKSGRLGEAIVWYERARRLRPRDADIAANLKFASFVRQDRVEAEENPLYGLAVAFYRLPAENELTALFSCSFFTLFGLAAWRLARGRLGGGVWLPAFVSCAVLTGLLLIFLGSRVRDLATETAVVTVEEAVARSGPSEDQTVVFEIHEGTQMLVQRREEEWLLVRLISGLGGWMRAADVTVI